MGHALCNDSRRREAGAPNLCRPQALIYETERRILALDAAQVMSYDLIGKRVRVHLYDHGGRLLGTIEGRVADVAAAVEVAPGMKKDLAYVVDIVSPDPETPYRNSAGEQNESWFAVQDLEVVDADQPRFFAN